MASTYLTRTSSVNSTAETKATLSVWVKKSSTNTSTPGQRLFGNTKTDDTNIRTVVLFDNHKFRLYNDGATRLLSTAQYRDFSAWYHIVVQWDLTQVTASDRIKVYINGERITAFDTADYPAQNATNYIPNFGYMAVGSNLYNGVPENYFDGLMTHFHFCDGYAYTASDFGSTDATTGIWKPKISPSVTYGANGFFLKFENSGSMGTDSSGNGNNFTVNGSLTQTQDTPSNLFCAINPINVASDSSGPSTLSNGNLTVSSPGTSQNVGTLAVDLNSNSKWYYEFKNISGVANTISSSVGWSTDISAFRSGSWAANNSLFLYAADGRIYGTSGWLAPGTAPTYSNNDIISCTVDLQNNEIKWYKNNSLAYTISSISWVGDIITPHSQWSESGAVGSYNFGNGYFGTTAIGSPNADENGYGKFNYTPPSGFLSLCTKNINTNG